VAHGVRASRRKARAACPRRRSGGAAGARPARRAGGGARGRGDSARDGGCDATDRARPAAALPGEAREDGGRALPPLPHAPSHHLRRCCDLPRHASGARGALRGARRGAKAHVGTAALPVPRLRVVGAAPRESPGGPRVLARQAVGRASGAGPAVRPAARRARELPGIDAPVRSGRDAGARSPRADAPRRGHALPGAARGVRSAAVALLRAGRHPDRLRHLGPRSAGEREAARLLPPYRGAEARRVGRSDLSRAGAARPRRDPRGARSRRRPFRRPGAGAGRGAHTRHRSSLPGPVLARAAASAAPRRLAADADGRGHGRHQVRPVPRARRSRGRRPRALPLRDRPLRPHDRGAHDGGVADDPRRSRRRPRHAGEPPAAPFRGRAPPPPPHVERDRAGPSRDDGARAGPSPGAPHAGRRRGGMRVHVRHLRRARRARDPARTPARKSRCRSRRARGLPAGSVARPRDRAARRARGGRRLSPSRPLASERARGPSAGERATGDRPHAGNVAGALPGRRGEPEATGGRAARPRLRDRDVGLDRRSERGRHRASLLRQPARRRAAGARPEGERRRGRPHDDRVRHREPRGVPAARARCARRDGAGRRVPRRRGSRALPRRADGPR
jgi:hypothetical protein